MMKKASHKLVLRQETVRTLRALHEHDLGHVRGGINTSPTAPLAPETDRGCTVVAIVATATCH
jgi:hypothetical protein